MCTTVLFKARKDAIGSEHLEAVAEVHVSSISVISQLLWKLSDCTAMLSVSTLSTTIHSVTVWSIKGWDFLGQLTMIIDCCAFWSELVYLFGNVSTMHDRKQKKKKHATKICYMSCPHAEWWMGHTPIIFTILSKMWHERDKMWRDVHSCIHDHNLTQAYKYSTRHTHIRWNLLKTFLKKKLRKSKLMKRENILQG